MADWSEIRCQSPGCRPETKTRPLLCVVTPDFSGALKITCQNCGTVNLARAMAAGFVSVVPLGQGGGNGDDLPPHFFDRLPRRGARKAAAEVKPPRRTFRPKR